MTRPQRPQRPLKIGIACYPTYGGSGILATELGIALAERGHEVHVFSYAEPPRLQGVTLVHFHLVQVAAYPLFRYPPYDLALTSKMLELMRSRDLDIIHAHYAIPHAMCAYLAKQMCPESHTRIVTTLHGTDITVVGSDESYRDVTRFAIEQSDAVLAVSRFLADETRRLFATDKPIHVAYNFVDTDRFVPVERSGLALPTLVHVSNFRSVKRPADVIKAFAILRKTLPAHLVLAGEGPELGPCLALARELGLSADVSALGARLDVERVLADCHVLLQPSGSEAFGLAALEAMSCGVPVVGYRVGGLPEVVDDGVSGFLVPFGDVERLAARSIELLTDEPRRLRFGAAARAKAVSAFTVDSSVDLHERIYRQCLGLG